MTHDVSGLPGAAEAPPPAAAAEGPPRGPDQHANQAGYQVIARTFQRAAGLS
jgi:hypothetical protein